MDAVILCGGRGTRLRSAVPDLPKPLAPIAGKPYLSWLLDYLEREGCERIVLCTGYGADLIEQFAAARQGSAELLVSREMSALGTGGALRLSRRHLTSGDFVLLNGDSICPVRLSDILQSHAKSGACATMSVSRVPDVSDRGAVQFSAEGRVTSFVEKTGRKVPGYVNAGVYAFSPGIFELLPPHDPCSLETEVFPRLIGDGLHAFPTDLPLVDIGTPDRFADAQTSIPELLRGQGL